MTMNLHGVQKGSDRHISFDRAGGRVDYFRRVMGSCRRGSDEAEMIKFKCTTRFDASSCSTGLRLLPAALLVVCFLIVSASSCARLIPVRENYFDAASTMSVPDNQGEPDSTISVPERYLSDLWIPSSFGEAASHVQQGSPAVSRTTQGGFLPLVPGRIVGPETNGPIPSTSPLLTPAQGSMAMPGGGFYPMR
jgi:hypothetical protein